MWRADITAAQQRAWKLQEDVATLNVAVSDLCMHAVALQTEMENNASQADAKTAQLDTRMRSLEDYYLQLLHVFQHIDTTIEKLHTHLQQEQARREHACARTQQMEDQLQEIQQIVARHIPQDISPSSSSSEWWCATCQRNFANDFSYKRHMRTQHQNEYRMNCPQCNKGFENQQAFVMHVERAHRRETSPSQDSE